LPELGNQLRLLFFVWAGFDWGGLIVFVEFWLAIFTEIWFFMPFFTVISSHSLPGTSVVVPVPRWPTLTKPVDATFYLMMDIKKNAKRENTESQINPNYQA
jgi:hypothetical protein